MQNAVHIYEMALCRQHNGLLLDQPTILIGVDEFAQSMVAGSDTASTFLVR
jgi:hypothetical protein